MYSNEQEFIKLLDDIVSRLERLERLISNSLYARQRKYIPQNPIGGMSLHNLAKRLAVSNMYLVQAQEQMSSDDFLKWSRSRDPMGRGWLFSGDGNFYPESK